jgi:hypothetical protein
MATTVKQSFKKYASNLELTDRQQETVSNCRQNVTNTLAKVLTLHPDEKPKVIGSWDRYTLTRYLSEADVDVMVILHYSKHKEWDSAAGTTAALDKFKQILQDKYPKTTMRRDTNCVTMALSNFRLDVVPAFKHVNGYYRIPDTSRGKWVSTNPFKFADLMSQVNTNMSSSFKPLIKMVKGWNRDEGWPIKSFHLESIMYYRYSAYTQDYTYSSMLAMFFKHLPSYLRVACYDPVTNDRLDGYLDGGNRRQTAIAKAEQAAKLSAQAFEYEDSNPEAAIKIWKVLLGEFFPAYG